MLLFWYWGWGGVVVTPGVDGLFDDMSFGVGGGYPTPTTILTTIISLFKKRNKMRGGGINWWYVPRVYPGDISSTNPSTPGVTTTPTHPQYQNNNITNTQMMNLLKHWIKKETRKKQRVKHNASFSLGKWSIKKLY